MQRRLALLAFAILISPQACSSSDDRPAFLRDDERLHVKVTLKLACEPLSRFAKDISEATGVEVDMRRDIADQNVSVFAEDVPAYDAMNQVALLFDYGWEMRGEAPKHGYVLFRPLKRKKEAEDLRQEHWRKEDQKFKDTIEDGVKLVGSDLATIQEEFDKNPAQVTRNMIFKDTLRALGCFAREEREAIWSRVAESPYGEIQIPFNELPPSLQKYFREQVERRALEGYGPGAVGIEERSLIISRGGGYGSPRISDLPLGSVIAFFGLSGIGGTAGLGVAGNANHVPDYGLERLREIGIDTSTYKPPTPEAIAPESKTKRLTIEFPKEQTRKPFQFGHTFAEILEAASRMLEISIFADDYLCRSGNQMSERSTFPDDVDEAIAEICREFECQSVQNGRNVRLRNETWYLDEAYEVPKRLVELWEKLRKDQGRLELRDYIEIAGALDNMHIKGLGMAYLDGDRPLLWETMCMARHLDRLRFCGTLAPGQMKTALEDDLPFAVMSPKQAEAFAYQLREFKPDLPDDALLRSSFRIRQRERERNARSDDTGEPMVLKEDVVTFTYVFGPGDEKSADMLLETKRLQTEKDGSESR